MKTYYNGYLFHKNCTERLYNPDMVLHFMDSWKNGKYPNEIIDMNVKTDYGKIRRLVSEDRVHEDEPKIETILEKDEIRTRIVQMFPLEKIGSRESFISLMFYMGLLTIKEAELDEVILKVPNLVIKRIFYEYIRDKYEEKLESYLVTEELNDRLRLMAKTGEAKPFIEYTYNQVFRYLSNRDLIKMEEKHIKMIYMSFLSITQAYIPYSELELNKGYSDIVLVPDSRYGVKNSQIWELKYIKEKENPESKIKEAKEQIQRYEKDEKFLRLSQGTQIFRYILLAYKDHMEILEP